MDESFSRVLQSYQGDGRMILNGCDVSNEGSRGMFLLRNKDNYL